MRDQAKARAPTRHLPKHSSRTLFGLPSRFGHPLPRLRICSLSSQLGVSAHHLNLAPNLRIADRLPPTPHPIDRAALSKKRLDRFVLESRQRTALLLLFSGHWTTRELSLSIGEATLRFLEKLDPSEHIYALSARRALTLVIFESRAGGPAPLLTVVAACRLRRLTLQAHAADIAALLPSLLRGVIALELRVLYSPPPQVTPLIDVLSTELPGALHSLSISPFGNSGLFEPLRPVCRAHRIVFSIQP